MTTKTKKQIHILPGISRSKGKQKMRFGRQLIECNMRVNFLENSFIKNGGETSPKTFFIKSKPSISLNQF